MKSTGNVRGIDTHDGESGSRIDKGEGGGSSNSELHDGSSKSYL